MKTFDLPAAVRLKLLKTTPNKEHHGDDLVQAISLRLAWETTNENLALLHPQLKDMLFWRPPQMDAQQTVEGVPEATPFLRVPGVAMPLKFEASFTGYTLTIEHGIDDSSALELYVCTLQKFAVDAKEGGTTTILFSLGSNKEITPELVGELCALEGGEIVATLIPPKVTEGEAIDGTKGHPGASAPTDGADAGDLFAELNGGDGIEERHAGDFGQADDDSAGPGAGSSDDMGTVGPVDGAVDTAANDAAELEAGMAQAMAAAGLKPKAARRARRMGGSVE